MCSLYNLKWRNGEKVLKLHSNLVCFIHECPKLYTCYSNQCDCIKNGKFVVFEIWMPSIKIVAIVCVQVYI